MIENLAAGLERFWIGMALHLWQTALFVGALALVALALRRTSARTLSVLYWAGVVKLLLPLPLLGPFSDRFLASITGTTGEAVSEAGWTVTVLMIPAVLEPGSPGWAGLPSAVWIALTSVWILGSVVILSRRARSAWSRRRLTAGDGTGASEKLRAALAETGIAPGLVRVGRTCAAPFVAGSLRPVIVLPVTIVERLDHDELCAVLIHEREHLRRRDPLRYSALAAVGAAFWFYPPVWWLVRRIRETTEMACDEAVVRAGASAGVYCLAVARVLSLGLARRHAIGILGRQTSFLHRRLERIRSGGRFQTMYSHRLTVAASGLAAVVLSLLPFAPVTPLRAGDEVHLAGEGLDQLVEAELPMALNFKETQAGAIYESIGATSGITFHVADEIADRPVSINVNRVPLKTALVQLGIAARANYRVLGPWDVEVNPILLVGADGVTFPTLILESKIKPEYPEAARNERIEGRVILQAMIDRTGVVHDLEVLNATPEGYESFAEAAVKAVSQWLYEPATRDGEPVDVYFTIQVSFELR